MSDFEKRKKEALNNLKENTEKALAANEIPFGYLGIIANYAITAKAIISARESDPKGALVEVNIND